MSYSDVLPLNEVKLYLRLDDDFTEVDSEIGYMRDAACEYIEKFTNHLLYQREKTYELKHGEKYIDVYDFPILASSKPAGVTNFLYATKTSFATDLITLTVGYASRADIPSSLIQIALQIVKFWYYDSEIKGSNNMIEIPTDIKNILFSYKRFIV